MTENSKGLSIEQTELPHEHLKFLWHNGNGDDVFECQCDKIIIRKCTCNEQSGDNVE